MTPSDIRRRGVTLLEALIALVVVALGLLAFMALQAKLRVNSDVAKQRSEAVRIAQENLENLRAFGTLANDTSIANNFSYDGGVVAGASAKTQISATSTSTNTSYAVTQTIVASAVAGMKDIGVAVQWVDRDDNTHRVALRSVIARADPRLGAALAIPPNGSPVKDPLGRNVRVPIPAKDLGNGTSVFKPNAIGGMAFVFNNTTGDITRRCDAVSSSATTAQIGASDVVAGSNGCVDVNGWLLSGYVRFDLSMSPSPTNANGTPPGPLSMRVDLDQTAPPTGTVGTIQQLTASYWPDAATAPWNAGYSRSPDCGAQDSKTVRFTTPVSYSQVNNGVTTTVSSTQVTLIVPAATDITAAALAPHAGLAEASILNPVDLGERYVAYTCVVYPRDFGGGRLAWTGRSAIVPSGWTIGTSSVAFKICRYSEDYNLNGYVWQVSGGNVTKIDNNEHAYAYLQAGTGLNNQNFLVIRGNRTCPTDGAFEVDGTGAENYTNETTVIHQM